MIPVTIWTTTTTFRPILMIFNFFETKNHRNIKKSNMRETTLACSFLIQWLSKTSLLTGRGTSMTPPRVLRLIQRMNWEKSIFRTRSPLTNIIKRLREQRRWTIRTPIICWHSWICWRNTTCWRIKATCPISKKITSMNRTLTHIRMWACPIQFGMQLSKSVYKTHSNNLLKTKLINWTIIL